MKAPYVKAALAACLIMSAMIAGTVSFTFFMDPVTSDLGFDRSTFSLYFSLITIVGTATLPLYGKLIARFGSRPFVVFGGIWTGLAMAVFSLCQSLPSFYVVGCLVGLGFFGCSYAAVPVIVSNWFIEKNGLVMGLAAACGGAFSMLLSFVFPRVILNFGWQSGYVLLGCVVCALTTPVGIFLLRSKPSDVGLCPYGGSEREAQADVDEELSGVSYRQALAMPQLWVTAIVFLLLAATVTAAQHLAAYFVGIGFDSVTAGMFMSVISAGIIVTNSLAGIVSDKIGLKRTLLLCAVLYAVSFILLPATVLPLIICVALVVMSIGNAYTSVFAPMVTRSLFGVKDYASLWGIVSMACVLGQAVGAPLWGLAYDMTGGYEIGMYISAIVVLVSYVALAWCIRTMQLNAAKKQTAEREATGNR